VDISPFTCMNGIVSESIYPKLSRDCGSIPIRNFYFDGTQADLDRDIEVFLELARSYQERKPRKRHYPVRFTKCERRQADGRALPPSSWRTRTRGMSRL
jgi:predicted nucleotide-binding protein (sugar kinase/HSP70/actin superfamily)